MMASPSLFHAAAVLAWFFQGEHNSLHPAGPFSRDIEWLYWVIFWIVFVAFVLTILAFARASAKTVRRPCEGTANTTTSADAQASARSEVACSFSGSGISAR